MRCIESKLRSVLMLFVVAAVAISCVPEEQPDPTEQKIQKLMAQLDNIKKQGPTVQEVKDLQQELETHKVGSIRDCVLNCEAQLAEMRKEEEAATLKGLFLQELVRTGQTVKSKVPSYEKKDLATLGSFQLQKQELHCLRTIALLEGRMRSLREIASVKTAPEGIDMSLKGALKQGEDRAKYVTKSFDTLIQHRGQKIVLYSTLLNFRVTVEGKDGKLLLDRGTADQLQECCPKIAELVARKITEDKIKAGIYY